MLNFSKNFLEMRKFSVSFLIDLLSGAKVSHELVRLASITKSLGNFSYTSFEKY